jgi:excisionase family DNA binding protein
VQSAYLTVPQVAAELDMSPDGVYKLIKRGRLPAIRRSERGLRVSRVALAAYLRRLRQSEVGLPQAGVLKGEVANVRAGDGARQSEVELGQGEVPQDEPSDTRAQDASVDVAQLRAEFERETGLPPREWERRWRADELEDTAEHMRLAIRALGLLLAE